MLVSIIILNWNGSKLLRKYLPSVVQHSPKDIAEVIVADNGSTDDSISILKTEFPSVKVISLDKNYGFAEGYNLSIQKIDTPYCILLNDDVRVSSNWIEPMLEYMETNPNVGAIQPKLLSDRNTDEFEYAGAAGGFLDKYGYPFCRGRIFNTIEKDFGQYDDIKDIMWATGACLMVRAEAFRKAGGLDSHFFAHMEEIDLCWRIRNLGYRIVYIPTSIVYHYGGGSLAMGNPRKTKLNFRNSLLMLYKNLPECNRSRKIFIRMILDGIAALNFLLHLEFSQVSAIWKAHCEYREMKKIYYSNYKRQNNIQNNTQQFPEENISILWNYYVHRIKNYCKLFRP